MKRIYFIDSENVGDSWLPLLSREEDEILVFYTNNTPYMNYNGLVLLKESPKEVTFIKCFEGTNALDFQLCSELGYRLSANDDSDEFIIVTNDTGYDAAVRYWQKKNYPVRRVQSKMVKSMVEGFRAADKKAQAAAKTVEAPKTAEQKAIGEPITEAPKQAAEELVETPAAAEPAAPEKKSAEEQEGSNKRRGRKRSGRKNANRDNAVDYVVEEPKLVIEEAAPAAEAQEEAAQQAEAEIVTAELADENAPADAPKKLSRREQWRQRQQARRQKKKELADSTEKPEEQTAESNAVNTEQPSEAPILKETAKAESLAAEEQTTPAAEPIPAAETEPAPAVPAVPIFRVEVKQSGVAVVPPDLGAVQPKTEAVMPKIAAEDVSAETTPIEETPAEEAKAETTAVAPAPETEVPAEAEAPKKTRKRSRRSKKTAEVEIEIRDVIEVPVEEAEATPEETAIAAAPEEAAAEETVVSEVVEAEAETTAEETTVPESVEAEEETTAEEAPVEAAPEVAEASAEVIPAEASETESTEAPAETSAEEAVEVQLETLEVIAEAEAPAAVAAEPEYSFNKKEVDTIIGAIGKANLADIHNSLELFYGEEGKEIYKVIKSAAYTPVLKKWNKEVRFRKYCSVIFAHSEIEVEIPKDFDRFLYAAGEKRNNLNTLRSALQSEYGKDQGMKLYSLVKAHIKLLNKM